MYVKIQKDLTNNYLIIEGKNVEFSTEKLEIDFKDYFEKYVPCYLKYDESANCSGELTYIQHCLFFNCDWANTHPVTVYNEHSKMPEIKAGNSSLIISGIIVDGIRYFTCGRVYIMNDNGKTVQSV